MIIIMHSCTIEGGALTLCAEWMRLAARSLCAAASSLVSLYMTLLPVPPPKSVLPWALTPAASLSARDWAR